MEIKRNEATRNRPEGDRVIDAPYVFVSLDDYIKQLKDEEAWDKNDRNGITLFKTDRLSTVLTCLKKNVVIKNNMKDELLQVHVIEGKIRVTTQDGDAEMTKDEIITFHPQITHSIEALKESVILIQTVSCSS